VAKAKKKPTIPRTRGRLRIAEIARRVALHDNLDDRKALVEANASLMEARDGDQRRLESRQSDKSLVLTLEEREFLAALPAAKRRAHRPERPSTRLKRALAKQVLTTALKAKEQWKPDYTIANLIAAVQAQSGLCRSDAWDVYKLVKAAVKLRRRSRAAGT
jgi:hypothetical protein